MVNSRVLRSAKSLDTAPAVPSTDDRSLRNKTPLVSVKVEPSPKRRGPPHVKALPPSSKSTGKTRSSPSAGKDSNEDEEGVDEDDAEDADDNADVNAPPSDCNVPVKSIEDSTVVETPKRPFRNSKESSWAGRKNQSTNDDVAKVDDNDDDDDDQEALQEDANATSHENDAVGVTSDAENLDEASEAEASDFEVADDDDDYDAVDNISVASDDSREFEADVEREIQAAGEDGIDWDDQNTYLYNNTLNEDIYGFAYESSIAQSLYGLDIFAFERDVDARLTQSEPSSQIGERMTKLDRAISENMIKLDRSMASESEESSVSATAQSKPVEDNESTEKRKPALKMETSFDDEEEGDTTDEDIPWTTVSSPGVTLSRQNSTMRRKPGRPKKGSRIPPQKRLPMRKIPPHPQKALAYSVPAPFGSTVRFITPNAKSYRWMDLRGRHSRHSSGASSPTMINLEDAYTQGNTRTGAHITDVINGTLFSALHCRGDSIEDPKKTEASSSISKFYQPLLKNEVDDHPVPNHQSRTSKPIEEATMALIDFTGGIEDDSSEEDEVMNDDEYQHALNARPNAPTISIADFALSGDELVNSGVPLQHVTGPNLQIPITPPPERDLVLEEDSSSPKKRRMSNRSGGRRSVSPAIKKQKYDGSNEVLV